MSDSINAPAFERAVIVAIPPTGVDLPAAPMATLVDRPIIQHVVERLCAERVRHIHVMGDERDLALRHFVCDNQRWGAHFRWQGARQGNCDVIRRLGGEDRVLVAFANVLPLHPLSDPALQKGIVSTLRSGGNDLNSPAWYAVDGQALATMPASLDLQGMRVWLQTLEEASVGAARVLSMQSLHELLASQRQLLIHSTELLHDDDPEIRLIGRQQLPGLRLCRNVKVHSTAEITGPVFVGDNSRIGKHVQLGPNTVIGPNCIVDHHAMVSNSLVLENTYLGPWVDVADSVVQQTNVTNVRLGVEVTIDDPLLLSAL